MTDQHSSLVAITCTGGRTFAFDLLCRWLRRQTFGGNVRWLIVNDVVDQSPELPWMPANWECKLICPQPVWQPGQNTQARNMLAALDLVDDQNDRVIILEDDDWYSPHWLQVAHDALDGDTVIAGEINARYYNIAIRKGREMPNARRACLSATAVRDRAIKSLRDACRDRPDFIDLELWHRPRPQKLLETHHVVGIKGLPGRPGIGIGHRNSFRGKDDPFGTLLYDWIGEEAGLYLAANSSAA